MTLSTAIAWIQGEVAEYRGMRAAPAQPPEGANQFPFSVCYNRNGELANQRSGFADELETIILEVHVSRALLSEAVTRALTYHALVLATLIGAPTLGDTVATQNGVRWTFGELGWGGVVTIGYRYEIDVKMHATS